MSANAFSSSVALVDPDRSAARLPAVERQVVLLGADGARIGVEQRNVLRDRGAEGVVGRVPALSPPRPT